MRPDKFTYVALVNVYARSSTFYEDASKAEGALLEMVDRHDLPNPDSKLCNAVISAWANSLVTRVLQGCCGSRRANF